MSISRREMSVSRREIKKWAYSFLFYSLFFTVLRRTFWQFSVGFFFSFYLLLWGLSLYIQVSQAQLSGVQECRSDASLRSVDDSDACMVGGVSKIQMRSFIVIFWRSLVILSVAKNLITCALYFCWHLQILHFVQNDRDRRYFDTPPFLFLPDVFAYAWWLFFESSSAVCSS